jgi:hypothetical protein
VVDEKVRASDGSITACSTHKTNWICRRSSRYERIRREALIQNRVSQTIRRERALAAAFGKCHRNAAGFGSDLCVISATWPISSKINGALNEALRPHLIRDFAFEQLSCPLAQIVDNFRHCESRSPPGHPSARQDHSTPAGTTRAEPRPATGHAPLASESTLHGFRPGLRHRWPAMYQAGNTDVRPLPRQCPTPGDERAFRSFREPTWALRSRKPGQSHVGTLTR